MKILMIMLMGLMIITPIGFAGVIEEAQVNVDRNLHQKAVKHLEKKILNLRELEAETHRLSQYIDKFDEEKYIADLLADGENTVSLNVIDAVSTYSFSVDNLHYSF